MEAGRHGCSRVRPLWHKKQMRCKALALGGGCPDGGSRQPRCAVLVREGVLRHQVAGYAGLQAAFREQYAAAHGGQALTAQEEKQWLMQCHSSCRIAHIKAYAAAQRAAELPLQQQVAAMEGKSFHGSNPDQSLFQVFPEAEAGGAGLAVGLGHEPHLMAVMPPPLSWEPCSPLADLLSRGAAWRAQRGVVLQLIIFGKTCLQALYHIIALLIHGRLACLLIWQGLGVCMRAFWVAVLAVCHKHAYMCFSCLLLVPTPWICAGVVLGLAIGVLRAPVAHVPRLCDVPA
jgi:hypothetical protein